MAPRAARATPSNTARAASVNILSASSARRTELQEHAGLAANKASGPAHGAAIRVSVSVTDCVTRAGAMGSCNATLAAILAWRLHTASAICVAAWGKFRVTAADAMAV